MASRFPNLNTTPASVSPNGVYDFNSPVNNAKVYLVVSTVFLVLATLCVALKLYVRFAIQRRPGLDDACLVGGLAFTATYIGLLDYLFTHGGARHQWDMSLATYEWVIEQQQLGAKIQQPAYLLIKLSLLLLFYRLFSVRSGFKWAIIAGCIVVTIIYLVILFLFVGSTALKVVVDTGYALAVINLATDLYILVLPIGLVSTLNMPLAKKMGVVGIFGVGLAAVALSSLGIYYRFQTDQGIGIVDQTYTVPPRASVLTVEMCIGILVSSFPVFPTLLREASLGTILSNAFQSLRSRFGTTDSSKSDDTSHKIHSSENSYPLSHHDKPVSLHSGGSAV
ncbi:hypothetical protein F5Y16DRAFT_387079 [Xylariaceae sp. FL0255]|nr:hypothetical protein F5Y16DRAFT_387079 [Xylariaceae sp. FL0255]